MADSKKTLTMSNTARILIEKGAEISPNFDTRKLKMAIDLADQPLSDTTRMLIEKSSALGLDGLSSAASALRNENGITSATLNLQALHLALI